MLRFRMMLLVMAGLVFSLPANAMSLGFSWGPTKKCFDSKSPPMKLSAVPKGTAKLRFRMVDLDKPDYPHGGGTVKWTGGANGSLPYGAFRYKGPGPPNPHTYRFTVDALDASGRKLGTAQASRCFP